MQGLFKFKCKFQRKGVQAKESKMVVGLRLIFRSLWITVQHHGASLGALVTEFEPPHDKTNKMSVHPAKTPISLGIRPV